MSRWAVGLVDTNIVIHLAELDRAQLPDAMVVSAVTVAEIAAGPHLTDDPEERARRIGVLQHVEAAFEPLPFDAAAARSFGLATAALTIIGRKPLRRFADLMIASIAMANRLPVFTTNPDDFAGLEKHVTVLPVDRPPMKMGRT